MWDMLRNSVGAQKERSSAPKGITLNSMSLLEAIGSSYLLRGELNLKIIWFHQPQLTWIVLSKAYWERIPWTFLLAHWEGREKWEMLGHGQGFFPPHSPSPFSKYSFFILSSLWGEANRASVKSLQLNWAHENLKERRKWTFIAEPATAQVYATGTVFEVHLCLTFTVKYAAKVLKARLPSAWCKIMSEQSSMGIFFHWLQ